MKMDFLETTIYKTLIKGMKTIYHIKDRDGLVINAHGLSYIPTLEEDFENVKRIRQEYGDYVDI